MIDKGASWYLSIFVVILVLFCDNIKKVIPIYIHNIHSCFNCIAIVYIILFFRFSVNLFFWFFQFKSTCFNDIVITFFDYFHNLLGTFFIAYFFESILWIAFIDVFTISPFIFRYLLHCFLPLILPMVVVDCLHC